MAIFVSQAKKAASDNGLSHLHAVIQIKVSREDKDSHLIRTVT